MPARLYSALALISLIALPIASAEAEEALFAGMTVTTDVFGGYSYLQFDEYETSSDQKEVGRHGSVGSFIVTARMPLADRITGLAQVRGRTVSALPAIMLEDRYYYDRAPKVDRVDLGDLYATVQPRDRYRVTVGRFVIPFGFTEFRSDYGTTFGQAFSVNPLHLDALGGSSTNLPREVGVRVDAIYGNKMLTLAAMRGIMPEAYGTSVVSQTPSPWEPATLIARGAVIPAGPESGGLSLSLLYSSDTNEATRHTPESDAYSAYGLMLDTQVFGDTWGDAAAGVSGFWYPDGDGDTADQVLSAYVQGGASVGPLHLAMGISIWISDPTNREDRVSMWMPQVGYTLYRASNGFLNTSHSNQQTVRMQAGVGWEVTEQFELHGEILADRFISGVGLFPSDPVPATTVAAIAGLRARL